MLEHLHVKNLALIREAEIDFTEGLNILTGETGAGKSIVIGSVGLALGGKVAKDLVRPGADFGLAELVFSVTSERLKDRLKELDVIPEDGQIILSRKIMNGKSINKINGETVTLNQLRETAALLIDVHGQHEHQSLLQKKKHLEILDEKGSAMQIIAKIENEEGIENIDSIIEASDGIMVARGDMGVEIPAEKVPHIQKMIIRKCNLACKVVITATQMLDSMIRNPRPTRAEVSDVANAVYEGTDAVMLSGETAMGSYPIEAVRMMSQIAEESEKYLDYMFYQRRKVSAENLRNISNTVCYSSVATASDLEAPVIVAPSVSGFTTRMLSKWRPKALIAGLSPSMTAVRQMQLYWGVKPFHAKRAESTDALLFASVELLKEKGIVKEGEIVVATAGVVTRANRHEPVADTNIMRVIVVE